MAEEDLKDSSAVLLNLLIKIPGGNDQAEPTLIFFDFYLLPIYFWPSIVPIFVENVSMQ